MMSSRREKELKELVEQQKEQIGRYEKKLRDVIHAYKGLQKEKEALDLSLKALSLPAQHEAGKAAGEANENSVGEPESTSDQSGDDVPKGCNSVETNSHEEDAESLKKKMATLLATITAITEEKSRMEVNFQNDRKRLLYEREELEKSLAAACSEAEQSFKNFKTEISELKTQLSAEKSERSRETANNQVVLRELQKTIAEERQMREALQLELNVKSSRLSQMAQQTSQLDIAEKKIKELKSQLDSERAKLRQLEDRANEPSPVVAELERELAEMKEQRAFAIHQEGKRAAEAEETIRQLVATHETRVAVLEARLSELSHTVGTYDRLRQQDLATVALLKEQLASLDRKESSRHRDPGDDEKELVSSTFFLEEIVKNYTAFQRVNRTLDEPVDAWSYLGGRGVLIENHEPCLAERERLLEEIKSFKSGPEAVLESTVSSEVFFLQEKLKLLMQQLVETEERNQERCREIQESLLQERERLKEEFLTEERNLKLRVADLEYQMKKQRERSLSLLEEKDEEIRNLRSMLQIKPVPPVQESKTKEENEPDWPEGLSSLASLAVGSSASGGQILHYVEELARKDIEIQNLRRSKNQLEASLRELQMAAAAREERFREERDALRENLERLERNRSRESANLEYLKNVIFNLLTRPDSQSQSHMVNAISTILHFSPREIQLVQRAHPSWKLAINK